MALPRRRVRRLARTSPEVLSLGPVSPRVKAYIASVRAELKDFSLSPDEVREIVDAAMGDKTLTEALDEVRGPR